MIFHRHLRLRYSITVFLYDRFFYAPAVGSSSAKSSELMWSPLFEKPRVDQNRALHAPPNAREFCAPYFCKYGGQNGHLVVEFMCFVQFILTPGESYCRRFRSLMLCPCLSSAINSLFPYLSLHGSFNFIFSNFFLHKVSVIESKTHSCMACRLMDFLTSRYLRGWLGVKYQLKLKSPIMIFPRDNPWWSSIAIFHCLWN